MLQKSDEPSWLNSLLVVATFLALSLVLVSVYRGWKEDRALHYSDEKGHTQIIADIPVNLSGIPRQEHCLTCHPQGRLIRLAQKGAAGKEHPDISPHSIYELGCTGCHLGEGMARDLLLSHGRHGLEVTKTLAGDDLQATLRGASWEGGDRFPHQPDFPRIHPDQKK